MNNIKLNFKELAIIMTVSILLLFIYFLVVIRHDIVFNYINIFVIISLSITIMRLIKDSHKFIIGKIFLISWMSGYYIYFFKLSFLQIDVSLKTELYILIIGFVPLIIDFLYSINKGRIQYNIYSDNISSKNKKWIIILLLIHISIFILESKIQGIPIFLGYRTESIGILHVISEVFLRVSFYLTIFELLINKKFIYYITVVYAFVYTILTMSRSLTIHFAIFILLIGFIYKKISVKKIIFSIILMLSIFVAMGNVRQGEEFNISEYASMKMDNKAISWIYGYIGPNYDNLALQIENGIPSNTLSNTLSPIITVTGLDNIISWYNTKYIYIGKLNVGTIFRDYVVDLGPKLALIPFIITIFVLCLIFYSKTIDQIKVLINILILSEIAISFFTNHFTSSVFWLCLFVLNMINFINNQKIFCLKER